MPHIREQLDRMGIDVPLIGDFHYNGHRLLTEHPACAEALSKYRINPGNVGKGDKRDRQFAQMVEIAAQLRQGGAHRRQLGQPGPGAAGADDGREREERRAARRAADHVPRADHLGDRIGAARRRDRPRRRADHPVVQGLRRAGPDQRLSRPGGALRLRAAPRPDRGRHEHQGHGRLGHLARRAAAGRHRRHDPRLAHAAARRVAHAGGRDRARDPAVARPAHLQPERHRLPGLRSHHQHHLPGTRQADRRPPARADADLARQVSRRREACASR